MALYFHNKLVLAPDYLKISNRYSSPQSFWRAKKKGFIESVAIGGLQFMEATPEQVHTLYNTSGFADFATVPQSQNLAGLVLLGNIYKSLRVSETTLLMWAITQRMDVYWIAGKLFGDLQAASRLAEAEKAQQASVQMLKPSPKPRRGRR